MNRVQPSPSGSALPSSCSRGFAGTVPSECNAVRRFLQLQVEATPTSLTPHVWVFCWGGRQQELSSINFILNPNLL